MKTLGTMLFIVFFSSRLFSQELNQQEQRFLCLKTNLAGPVSLTVEKSVKGEKSILITGQVYESRALFSDLSYYSVNAELRWYPSESKKASFTKFHVGPYLKYTQSDERYQFLWDKATITYSKLSLGGIFGRQWVSTKGVVLDLFIGGGLNYYIDYEYVEYSPTQVRYNRGGPLFELRAGLCVGVSSRK